MNLTTYCYIFDVFKLKELNFALCRNCILFKDTKYTSSKFQIKIVDVPTYIYKKDVVSFLHDPDGMKHPVVSSEERVIDCTDQIKYTPFYTHDPLKYDGDEFSSWNHMRALRYFRTFRCTMCNQPTPRQYNLECTNCCGCVKYKIVKLHD